MGCPGAGVCQHVDLTTERVVECRRAAFVGNGVQLDACSHGELFHAHVGRAAHAGMRVAHFPGVGFGIRHHVLQGFEFRLRHDRNAKCLA